MAYTLLAFATARLSTEVDLLAIGDLIVHLFTGSFVYVPGHRTGSNLHDRCYLHQMRFYGCVRWCHYIASVNHSHSSHKIKTPTLADERLPACILQF